ncbi:MAG TPA: TIR domain-containing protein [Sphingomicrobium sp.]|nr:TIR domain-containing protein [Sphingomicrobium sp.]
MADVFISYARTDAKIARRLAAALQKAGHSLWWDADLSAHRSYSDEIESQLREAKAVVVLWSKEAAASQWVRAEADVARNGGKLVQLSIDGTVPPIPFNQIQSADLTGWRGGAAHPGLKKALESIAALSSREATPAPEPIVEPRWWNRPVLRWSVAVATLMLLAAVILAPRFWSGQQERPVVAVLPFQSLDKGNSSLVAGIWEDTRQAIGRNPQLLVLGPITAEEIARNGAKSAAKLADYLVEASVRSAGDRIRVNANLVRTDDGAQMWSKSFERDLDDVFALQSEIAGEIEGHIRGRLAERGGVQPENIATSGEIYALYSDARTKIRQRKMRLYPEALKQLEQVVRMDPNFAPGWATLAVAKRLEPSGETGTTSEADARRAIALAPNLAAGHAALGFVLAKGPAAEASLRRALELDPNDIEAIHWLANSMDPDTRSAEKLALYSKVVELEPLWWPAIFNKVNLLFDGNDPEAVDRELARVEAIGNRRLAAAVRAQILHRRGDLSGAIKAAVPYLRNASGEERELLAQFVLEPLIQLGLFEIVDQIIPPPGEYIRLLRTNDPRAIDMIEAEKSPKEFWLFGPLPTVSGRIYLASGQGPRLANRYRAVASSPQQFLRVVGDHRFLELAPLVALSLRADGDKSQEHAILELAEQLSEKTGARFNEEKVTLARIHAVQGRKSEAIRLLMQATESGWLPNFFQVHTDIALDPPLNELREDPRFEQIRRKLLAYFAKERAELGTVRLN